MTDRTRSVRRPGNIDITTPAVIPISSASTSAVVISNSDSGSRSRSNVTPPCCTAESQGQHSLAKKCQIRFEVIETDLNAVDSHLLQAQDVFSDLFRRADDLDVATHRAMVGPIVDGASAPGVRIAVEPAETPTAGRRIGMINDRPVVCAGFCLGFRGPSHAPPP